MFTGKARAAYQAAKDIPEILAQLPCFCGCMDSRNLDTRAISIALRTRMETICDLCQTIALEAKEMHRKGMPIETDPRQYSKDVRQYPDVGGRTIGKSAIS